MKDDDEYAAVGGMNIENWQGKPMYSKETCPSATLSTTNPTSPNLGSSPGRRQLTA
jgi:hypothetical protein